MSRLSYFACLLLTGGLLLAGTFLCETSARAQEGDAPKPESAKITTADGVRLHTVFYASPKKGSPTVLMLHPIGEGKGVKSKELKDLAESLQKANYSVMMFDFRGHGDSTTIEDPATFWALQFNNLYVKTKAKDSIDVRDYHKNSLGAYLPVLVNDIAAVKEFLDKKHELGLCNTSNTVVIGADNGATLGAIWINSEWSRFKFTPNQNMNLAVQLRVNSGVLATKPEGNDITAAIFLTIQPNLDSRRPMAVSAILRNPTQYNGMATLFFYGKEDEKAKGFAKGLESKLKEGKGKKHEFIGAVELNTNLTGVKLLQKGLKTDALIVKYLDNLFDSRSTPWGQRGLQNPYYMWVQGNQRTPANFIINIQMQQLIRSEKHLNFDNYQKFIPPN